MKLRTKLVLLSAGIAALFLLSVAAYFAILSPLDRMQSEVGSLQEVARATSALEIESSLLALKTLGTQRTAYQEALKRYQAAQESMNHVVYLIQASPELAAAVEAVKKLGALSNDGFDSIESSFQQIKDLTDKAKIPFESSSWTQLFLAAEQDRLGDTDAARYVLSNLTSNITKLDESLKVTRQVVEKKDAEINLEYAKIKERSSLAGLSVILLALAASIALSFVLARNIARDLSGLGTTVAQVSAGDLRVRFGRRSKDELGLLARDIDALLESLTAAFKRIQAASAENLEVKDQLAQSVSSATSSSVEIEANSTSILGQLQKVDERVQSSEAELNGVVILLEAFRARLETQSNEVADATAAVAELAQGISRISELSDENRREVETLLAESDRGREVFDRSFTKVAEINESVSDIQDLAGAIAEIAGQTNILSLNAAIEAAHAGEAGKGFAVVADEISKLASASAQSSAQIAATIKDVVGKIREAGATRVETLGAFEAIGTQIARVSDRSRGIDDEADHMNQGTHRIRQVMETLTTGASDTTKEADRVGAVATRLGDTMGQVGRISHEVVSNIGEITQGLGEITRTVNEVAVQAERLRRVGDALDQAVNAFQTDTEPEAVEEI
jgi:methyl-accepting chemotaxis protein